MSKSITHEVFDDVVTITFDQEKSIANVFNEELLEELAQGGSKNSHLSNDS